MAESTGSGTGRGPFAAGPGFVTGAHRWVKPDAESGVFVAVESDRKPAGGMRKEGRDRFRWEPQPLHRCTRATAISYASRSSGFTRSNVSALGFSTQTHDCRP